MTHTYHTPHCQVPRPKKAHASWTCSSILGNSVALGAHSFQAVEIIGFDANKKRDLLKKKTERRYRGNPKGESGRTAGTGSTWTRQNADTCALALCRLLGLVRSACIGDCALFVCTVIFLFYRWKSSVMLASRPRSMALLPPRERVNRGF